MKKENIDLRWTLYIVMNKKENNMNKTVFSYDHYKDTENYMYTYIATYEICLYVCSVGISYPIIIYLIYSEQLLRVFIFDVRSFFYVHHKRNIFLNQIYILYIN